METYEIVLGVLGIILLSASIIFINIIGFKCLFRVILVKKRQKAVKGIIIDYGPNNCATIQYDIGNKRYSEECHIMFFSSFSPLIMSKSPTTYCIDDEVTVYYDYMKPSRCLIDGSSSFYLTISFVLLVGFNLLTSFIVFAILASNGII